MASPAPTAAGPSAPLQNIYYERKVATARPCYICKRPTTTVLSTLKTEDFLYTCDGHLTDPGFATPIAAPAPSTGPTPEDIRKVVSDYQAREARKAAAAAGKANTDDNKDKDKDKDDKKEKDEKTTSPAPPSSSTSTTIPTTSTPPAPTHRKFALHRSMFEMRRNELRRREQGTKAKEVSRGMPQVPRTAF